MFYIIIIIIFMNLLEVRGSLDATPLELDIILVIVVVVAIPTVFNISIIQISSSLVLGMSTLFFVLAMST